MNYSTVTQALESSVGKMYKRLNSNQNICYTSFKNPITDAVIKFKVVNSVGTTWVPSQEELDANDYFICKH